MKKIIIMFFLLSLSLLLAENVSIINNSELQFIYRDISDMEGKIDDQDDFYPYVYFKHFSQIKYSFLEVGAKFVFYKPRYDKFLPANLIGEEKDELYFDEYYLKFAQDYGFLQLGKISTSIGSGFVLNAQYDDEFNTDSRITGFDSEFNYKSFTFKLFGGISPWNKPDAIKAEFKDDFFKYYDYKKDAILGTNIIFPLLEGNLINGISYVYHKELEIIDPDKKYQKNNIFAYRNEFNYGLFSSINELAYKVIQDFKGEEGKDETGLGFLTNQTFYLTKASFSVQYKYFDNFDGKIHDVTPLNHYEETVFDDNPGEQEQGILFETNYNITDEMSCILNYSENWTNDYDYKLSDFYGEITQQFSNSSLTVDYEQLEVWNIHNWKKEMSPHVMYDFFVIEDIPMILKFKYAIKKEKNAAMEITYFEPKIQTDITILGLGISLIIEHRFGDDKYGNSTDFGDSEHFWVGSELAYNMFNKADLKLFFGKEKEGKVCRNGVCKKQPEFSGIRFDVSTSF